MRRIAEAVALLVVVAVPAYAITTVTPEPATIGLVATGAGVLGVAAWFRRRKR